MPIKLGETAASLSSAIAKVMLGDALVWQPTPSGPVSYTLTEVDTHNFDATQATYVSSCKIDDAHFIVAYCGSDGDGFIKTFAVDGSYNVSELDSLEHDTTQGQHNSLIKIDDTHYLLAYSGSGNDGYLSVFSINGSYEITELSNLEQDTSNGQYNSLALIDSSHFILAYKSSVSYGVVKSFVINGDYSVTQLGQVNIDTSLGEHFSVTSVDSTHFAVAYSGAGNDGFIKIYSLDEDYAITQLSVVEHNTTFANHNSLVLIDDEHLILVYSLSAVAGAGHAKTFVINEDYTLTEVDSISSDATQGQHNSLAKIDTRHYALAYTGPDYDGFIKTYSIDAGCDNIAEIDSAEHDTSDALYNSLFALDATHLVLAYSGTSTQGFIKIFEID